MFAFDPTTYTVRTLKLKALSKSTIDPRVTFIDENDKLVKLPIPTSICRRIRNRLNGVTKFTTFYPCEIAFVDDRIVSMDVPDGFEYNEWKNTGKWTSRLSNNCKIVPDFIDMEYDGQYVYEYECVVEQIEDSSFGKQLATVYDLYRFGELHGNDPQSLAALAYKDPATGTWTATTPITRASGGLLQLTGETERVDKKGEVISTATDLLRIDKNVFPNLRFVNYAARVISDHFGYNTVEPLGLPLLMIEHRTFNLGGLPTPVQATAPAPFSFTEGLAWMIGMFGQVKTLDQLIAVKQSVKMLLSKGNTSLKSTGNKDDDGVDTKDLIDSIRTSFDAAPLIKF